MSPVPAITGPVAMVAIFVCSGLLALTSKEVRAVATKPKLKWSLAAGAIVALAIYSYCLWRIGYSYNPPE